VLAAGITSINSAPNNYCGVGLILEIHFIAKLILLSWKLFFRRVGEKVLLIYP